jgi:predicted transcriptional regulator
MINTLDQDIKKKLALLNPRQKKTVLAVIENFADEQTDWWDRIGEDQQKAIDDSIAQMKKGVLIAHEEVVKKHRWLKK